LKRSNSVFNDKPYMTVVFEALTLACKRYGLLDDDSEEKGGTEPK